MNSLESFVKFIPSANNVNINVTNSPVLTDLESKAKKFTNNLNDALYETSNEPSLGFYRIQEHVRKTIPNLNEKHREMDLFHAKLKGANFDLDYSNDAVAKIASTEKTFESVKTLLTDSLYAARQISIKNSSRLAAVNSQSQVPLPSTPPKQNQNSPKNG